MLDKTPKCRGTSTEVFYDKHNWAVAAQICRGCPVILECRLDFAEDPYAFAGGMTPEQRSRRNGKGGRPAPARPSPTEKVPGGGGRRILTDETKAEILRLFDEESKGSRAIALCLGIAPSTASRYLKDNNRRRTEGEKRELSRRFAAKGNATQRAKGEETARMVMKLADEDYSRQEVADMTGLSYHHVSRIISNNRKAAP